MGTYQIWHHQNRGAGCRVVLGLRGVWGGVRKDRGVIVAPPH